MAPKAGDEIDGRGEIVKVEDYGHDTALRYTMSDGRTICGAHWDFTSCDCGKWHFHHKPYSGWGE
jgi:hypothetical protein